MLISMIHTLFTPDVPERSICFFVFFFFYIKRLFIALKSETIIYYFVLWRNVYHG